MRYRVITTAALVGALAGAGSLVLAEGPEDEAPAIAGPRPPVVMIGFDEFPIDAIRMPNGRIDPARFPNFARFARDATWWPNAVAAHDSTPRAFPAILDGRRPREDVTATPEGHPQSVFTLFGERGYEIVSVEEATDICPPAYCPGAADRRHGILHNLTDNGREERMEEWMRSIRANGQPAFHFKHVLLPHLPWIYLPSGRRIRPSIGHLAATDGFHDRGLAAHNQQRMLLQIGYVDRQLGRLMRLMKGEGIYDESMIVLTADHGISFEVGVSDRRKLSTLNVDEVGPVPFFVKAPGRRAGGVSPAWVSTVDLVPTMADVLGIAPGWEVEGVSGFSSEAWSRRVVRVPRRFFDGYVTIGAREMQRRRRANIARRTRRFGTGPQSLRRHGDPFASLYRGGPDGWLVGRRASSFARLPRRVLGALARRRQWRDVRPRAKVVPVQAAGCVYGGGPDATRELAVAVNGRIEATGRTFHLRGPHKRETFSVMVPETALRRGRNTVDVFEVVHRRASVALRSMESGRRSPVLSRRCLRSAQEADPESSGSQLSADSATATP